MNKVLSNQTSWSLPTSPAQPRRQENFAEKLDTKSRKEPSPPRTGHFAATGDSTVSKSSGTTVPPKSLGSPSMANSGRGEWETSVAAPSESYGGTVDGDLGPTLDAIPVRESAFISSIGLLPGMLMWSRVYPEHLVASGYLSVVDTAAQDGNVPSAQGTQVVSDADIHESATNAKAVMCNLGLDAERAVPASSDTSSPSTLNGWGTKVSGLDPEVVSSPHALDTAMLADHFWAERLVRLTHDRDGRSTVWLRDYGLTEANIESVAAKLRQRGQQEGVPISRVVINGREVWRAAASKGEG